MKTTLLAILCNILLALPCYATTYHVNTILDGNDANPGDGICADASGNCSLRAAIQEANTTAAADIINLPAGTYTLTIAGANEDASLSGDLDITTEIYIVGANAWTCIIDADRLDRVFHVSINGRLTISQTTVRNGLAQSGNGGGFLNEGFTEINYCCLDTNVCQLNQGLALAGGMGGGIANNRTLIINNSTLQGNVAIGGRGNNAKNGGGGGGSSPGLGGGIFQDNFGNSSINNCTFSANRALGGSSSNGSVNGGNFSFAGAGGAGALAGGGGAAGGGAGANGGDFSGGGGGGSSCGTGGNGGTGGFGAGGGGRGARSCGGASGNVGLAGFGGGNGNGSCCSSSGGGGAGAGMGGALFVNNGIVSINSSTLAFNEAGGGFGRAGQGGYAARGLAGFGFGGGIFNRNGQVTMNNSIVSNNIADQLNNLNLSISNMQGDLFGNFTSTDGHNLIMTPGTAVIAGVTTNNILNQDPQLMPLNNNGGAANTHETDPCAPSVVIDAGFATMPLDQRDLGHVAQADIGAFEQQDPCIILSEDVVLFEATIDNNTNNISWEQVSGNSFDRYVLYKSIDGINWNIAYELSVQNPGFKNYEYVDEAPAMPLSYYRLQCVEQNGTYHYTQTLVLERQIIESPFIIAPNPFRDVISVNWPQNGPDRANVLLFDSKGRLLLNQSIKLENGQIKITPEESISKGIYILKIQFDDSTIVRKVVKE